jgi:hypothetical protein
MAKHLQTKDRIKSSADLLDLDTLEEALSVRACHLINDLFSRMKDCKEPAKTMDNEIFGQEKLAMMVAHFDCLTITIFRHCVAAKQLKNVQNRSHLNLLCKIYALDSLNKNTSILYSSGVLSQGCHSYFFPAMDNMA